MDKVGMSTKYLNTRWNILDDIVDSNQGRRKGIHWITFVVVKTVVETETWVEAVMSDILGAWCCHLDLNLTKGGISQSIFA